jgi:hypothetical protein
MTTTSLSHRGVHAWRREGSGSRLGAPRRGKGEGGGVRWCDTGSSGGPSGRQRSGVAEAGTGRGGREPVGVWYGVTGTWANSGRRKEKWAWPSKTVPATIETDVNYFKRFQIQFKLIQT